MGSEFFWFLDIAVLGILAANLYRGAKKGAVAVLISAVAAIAAFIAAFAFNGVISEKIYDSFIRSNVEDYMSEKLGDSINKEMIKGLSETDMSEALVNGTYLRDIQIKYDDKRHADLDMSAVDLTRTGVQYADLSGFGIDEYFDWSYVKLGHLDVTETEVNKYGLGNIVLARIIAANLTSLTVTRAFTDIGDKLADTVSPSLRSLGSSLSSGSTDAVYSFMVSILTVADQTFGDRIMDDIITPTVMIPLRAIMFCILFALVMLILGLIANATKVINKIPVVSSVNGVLGALLGLVEGLVIIFLLCIIIKLLISLCGDSLVFLNRNTIDRTYLFRHLYSFDPLALIGKI